MEKVATMDLFFEVCQEMKDKGVIMKRELKCVRCGCPMVVGKRLHAQYTCPTCRRQYIIHGDGHLTVEGQI